MWLTEAEKQEAFNKAIILRRRPRFKRRLRVTEITEACKKADHKFVEGTSHSVVIFTGENSAVAASAFRTKGIAIISYLFRASFYSFLLLETTKQTEQTRLLRPIIDTECAWSEILCLSTTIDIFEVGERETITGAAFFYR